MAVPPEADKFMLTVAAPEPLLVPCTAELTTQLGEPAELTTPLVVEEASSGLELHAPKPR